MPGTLMQTEKQAEQQVVMQVEKHLKMQGDQQTDQPAESNGAPIGAVPGPSPGAVVMGLFHIAIKTANLPASLDFYRNVLGLKDAQRPAFDFPGAWLACPALGGSAIIHLYAGGPALGGSSTVALGSAAIDHVSLACIGFDAFRARFAAHQLPWREFLIPGTTLWQLFVYDPSGVQFELTFEGAAEAGPPPDMSLGRGYIAGMSFFKMLLP